MKHIQIIIWKLTLPLLLVVIIGVLCAVNYTPNTWLSGWDTLHPEWNFSLAFSRMLNGVWRMDQGLGSTAIQSHMADLPRVVWLWIVSLAVPTSFLRYSYFFLMLFVGPLGIYALARKMHVRQTGAFIGALLYLGNLGTLQHFIVPLEMFATLYGLLPWLILTTINLVTKPTKQSYLSFFIVSFLATPMAQTATLFYAYAAILLLFVTTYVIQLNLSLVQKIRRVLIVFILVIFSNGFWLFPNIYAAVMHGKDVQESKVNQLFSPEAFAKNQAFGTIDNAIVLKNFLFDWTIYAPTKGTFVDIMGSWKPHLAQTPVKLIGLGLFVLSLVGIVTVIRTRYRIGIALIPVWIVGLSMLLSGTAPLTALFAYLTKTFPLAGEALRFPFTKFSILYMLPFAIFGGIGATALLSLYKNKLLRILFSIEISLAIIAFMLPAFTGHLIHPLMRISYPAAYQEMFTWFATQNKNDRVAILPNHTFWNWAYYDWGYQGAGFLQFGIPQPILDRDYDRWNVYNEQYQRELSYALYSKQPLGIRKVFEKYAVTLVLLDTSVIAPGDNKNATLSWQLPELLAEAGLEPAKTFSSTITIYRVTTRTKSVHTAIPTTLPLPIGEPHDETFAMYGAYQTTTNTLAVNKEARNARTLRVVQDIPIVHEAINTVIDETNPLLIVPLPLLDHTRAYVVTIYSKNQQGFSPQLCLLNDLTKRCDIFTRLHDEHTAKEDRFLLPPLADFGTGYSVVLKNEFIGTTPGIDIVYTVSVTEVPWSIQSYVDKMSHDTIVTNNQSFEAGWRAYITPTSITKMFPMLFGTEILSHVTINSWENGWILPSVTIPKNTITFVYVPQYLELAGLILGITFLGILALKKHI